jgi:hypothetical protein
LWCKSSIFFSSALSSTFPPPQAATCTPTAASALYGSATVTPKVATTATIVTVRAVATYFSTIPIPL